ncbi:class 1 fructose-bisphosphatase [Halocatena pleomorpha]|uniref:Fructose-1,6-bisphosphatase class 1 n=1 Tax=Halocatena pleomorpha TaxID=1785090 RepID=A0A3P3RIN1_9EURY|nr:class 1 fructose-bisphosphatase [Halocatena pleomorpha]RRJ32679.1 fructose-1,6-bisphosphatase [Halocatena pleomorpha]
MSVETIFDVIASSTDDIRDSLAGRRTYADGQNPSGEQQLAADVHADRLLEERLLALDSVGAYASEEREEISTDGAGYSVAVDPLDGSSNVKSNNAMGTVLGVYDAELPAPGRSLIAAAYVLYGPLTTMMTAHDGTVTEYVVEDGARQPVRENVTLPDDPVVYGFGGRVPEWPDDFSTFASSVEQELKLRYGGAMIADVNQVMTYGGVFAYPALESHPDGKLRLLFEGAPIGYIVETAGGRSSDGSQSLLDGTPSALHQRVPVHVGNAEYIAQLEERLQTR